VEELKGISEKLPTPETVVPSEEAKSVGEAKTLAESGGEEQKKDISISEGIIQNVSDSLETALDSLEKEDPEDVISYLDKVLLQVNRSLKSKVGDPERKKAVSSRLEALVGRSSKLLTSDILSSDEKKEKLIDMLNKFLKDFENLGDDLQEQEKKILEDIRALNHFPTHDILNKDVTDLIQSVQTLVPEEETSVQAPTETVENVTSEAESAPADLKEPTPSQWEEPGVQFSKIVRGFGDFVAKNDYDVPSFMLDFAEKIPHKKAVIRALGEDSSQAERLRKSFDNSS
jgi:murein DD-endopeptidase MepM/ murein hydrolase activator NlpD